MRAPTDLKKPGRRLWKQVASSFELNYSEELLAELCRIADRLAEIREQVAADGLMVDGKAHPLLSVEAKLSAQLRMLWRTLGLADEPEQAKRPPGRPTNAERREWAS